MAKKSQSAPHDPYAFGFPRTVGELKAILAPLPDDMPLHHHGNMGDNPRGLMLYRCKLARHKHETDYFADFSPGSFWAEKPKQHHWFDEPFDALST